MKSLNNTKLVSIYTLPADKKELVNSSDIISLAKRYSEMKYGSRTKIREFAKLMFKKYEKDFEYQEGELYIASTLTSDIDSSSHLIAKELQKIINRKRLKHNLKSCKYIELLARKKILVSSDYGKVQNIEDRMRSQSNMELITYPNLKSNDLLLVINDSYVTGAQWKLQDELLRNNGLSSNINYYFIIKFEKFNSNFDISVEDFFNNYLVKTESDFINLLFELSQARQLSWNKRTILRSLNFEQLEWDKLINGLRLEDLNTFYNMAILSDSHIVNKGEFIDKISQISEVLKRKSREKDLNLRSPKDA